MPTKKPLALSDFPVHVHDKNIKKNDGKPIASAEDEKTAEDVADRLNEDEARREEDRWSA